MSEPTSTTHSLHPTSMERSVPDEVLEWYRMSYRERWTESMRLWDTFFLLGGQLEPESDSQGPFHDPDARGEGAAGARYGDHTTGTRG